MRKKLFSLLLSLAMVITMMPAMTMTAWATTSYNVWVAGTEITSNNNSDVFDNGKVSYDPSSKTLTLTGMEIGKNSYYNLPSPVPQEEVASKSGSDDAYAYIYAEGDLNIVLDETNKIATNSSTSGAGSGDEYGIYCGGKLNCRGTGSLKFDVASSGSSGSISTDDIKTGGWHAALDAKALIYAKDSVTIDSGNYSNTGLPWSAIRSRNITINNGTFDFQSYGHCIYSENFTSQKDEKIKLTINGGTFTLKDDRNNPTYNSDMQLGMYSIFGQKDVDINGGTLNITSHNGIRGDRVEISGSNTVVNVTNNEVENHHKSTKDDGIVSEWSWIHLNDGCTVNVDVVQRENTNPGDNIVLVNGTKDYDGDDETCEFVFENCALKVNNNLVYTAKMIDNEPYYEFKTLNEVINEATTGSTIKLTNDYELLQPIELRSHKKLTLDLNGHKITRVYNVDKNPSMIFIESGDSLTIKDTSNPKTGEICSGDSKFGYGGAIWNEGILNFESGIINDCKVSNTDNNSCGGAIYNRGEGAKFTMGNDATIKNCTAEQYGGAIFNFGGTVEINGGTIDYCKVTNDSAKADKAGLGGAIWSNNRLIINGGTIKNCSSAYAGGAIFNEGRSTNLGKGLDSVFKMTGGTIKDCSSAAESVEEKTEKEVIYLRNSKMEMSNKAVVNGDIYTNNKDMETSQPQCQIDISGGKFNGNFSTTPSASACAINITGGKFIFDPTEFVTTTGYKVRKISDNPYFYEVIDGRENPTPVSLLRAYKSGSKNVKLTWNKVSGATKYVIYGSRCGYKYKKIKTVKGTTYTVKKIGKKKIKAHRTYKFYVVAYNNSKKLVSSNRIHYITANTMGRYANVKSIKPTFDKLLLSVGATKKIRVTKKMFRNKKHIRVSHGVATRYITSNKKVATVSKSGVVKAVGEGTATIYTQDIGGRYCKTVVTVTVPVEKIVLEATADANVGDTIQLNATVLPENATNKNLVWESDNEEVVTVSDDGIITGVSEGTATITAKSVSNPTIKATCEVTVWPSCLAEGTLITMADGSKVAVENLKRGDDVVTFNHETGKKSHSTIVDYYKFDDKSSKAMTLHFSDDFDVTVVTGHAFYDKSLRKYVNITVVNVEKYIGHKFFCMEDMSWKTLNGYTKLKDKKDSYVVVTKNHLNCVANGMLSNEDDIYCLLANVFEFDDNMKIDQDKKKADIQKYGLWTYDDIEYLTEEAFDGLNLKYLGILVGNGILTEDIINEKCSYMLELDPELVLPEKRND